MMGMTIEVGKLDEDARETVSHLIECFGSAEMRFCPNCGARMAEPQESEDKE